MGHESSPEWSKSRREFLQGAASASLLSIAPRWLHASAKQTRTADLFVTHSAEKYAKCPPIEWKPAVAGGQSSTVEINSTHQFQPVVGFGTALTDSSCYLLNGMPAATRHDFLSEVFSSTGLNLNMSRCSIGASDYSRNVYNYDDVADDKNLDHFSLKHDEAYILPTLREVRAIQPDLFVVATPWSPPGWMKTYGTTFGGRTKENYLDPYADFLWDVANNSMLGGWMSERYLDVYARYLQKFLRGYAAAGVPVQALTTQNEINTTQHGTMPACRWSPLLEVAFVRDHLGPLLRGEKDKTQIWILDHNYDHYERVLEQLQDKQFAQYVDGVAWHGYFGTPDQMSRVHQQHPQVPFFWTEGGSFTDDPTYLTEWTKWGGIYTDILENWCRSAITWNLVLDARGNPNLGPYTCAGLVTLNDDGTLKKSGQYYALAHFSRHLQRNSRRIATSGGSNLRHVAVQNPDGSYALVLTNSGSARDVKIVANGQQVTFNLPGDSVATLAWRD
jgi:glucosylceramidase